MSTGHFFCLFVDKLSIVRTFDKMPVVSTVTFSWLNNKSHSSWKTCIVLCFHDKKSQQPGLEAKTISSSYVFVVS